ncbi:MAG: c-type cytochrome [Gammaproteobacteria bacterium]
MGAAIVLVLIAIGSVIFHFWSPWWFTPLSSNWDLMDVTLIITFWITGFVFVAILLFMAYALVRYRYRADRRAAYEPENKRLEWWLIGLTTVGIVAMLVPGLYVWAMFIDVPKDAFTLEAVGQQWKWTFRLPGKDGELGRSDTKLISGDNPFGLSLNDPKGQDDVLVSDEELRIPLGRPVLVLLRGKDVLHDFYVPHFRVKMDVVPGMVTRLWFTPTVPGKYEVACAEYCGIGHHTMRGVVLVEKEADFKTWLAGQPTFAQTLAKAGSGDPLVDQGRKLAQDQGCVGCHSQDGSPSVGPTWKGLFGKTQTFADASSAAVDETYIRQSIANPNAKVVKGYSPMMPPYQLSDEELNALLAYIRTLTQ